MRQSGEGPAMTAEDRMNAESMFPQDDYFKIDPEAHLVGRMGPLEHFPGVRMWWKAVENIRRPLTLGTPLEVFEASPRRTCRSRRTRGAPRGDGPLRRRRRVPPPRVDDVQIPEDLRDGYGYPEITDDDRRMIFGGNLARLIGIEPTRRIGAKRA